MSRRFFEVLAQIIINKAEMDKECMERLANTLEKIMSVSEEDIEHLAVAAKMTERQTEVFQLRCWQGNKVDWVANKMHVNRSRVGQLERAAIKRIKKFMAKLEA